MMIIAGPCSIEGPEFVGLAIKCQEAGATHIRGGIYKPRSSPFRWSGIGKEALPYVQEVRERTRLPFVAEAMSWRQIEELYPYVDVFQVGARNQQDTELLKEFGRQDKPVLMKRGMATTIEELMMAADFILNEGNPNVILCERGIRTFERYTRNTFDCSCIAVVKQTCKIPILADASHGTGRRELVEPVTLAGIAAGADGFMVEVHQDPDKAMTDAEQSITPEMFRELVKKAYAVRGAIT